MSDDLASRVRGVARGAAATVIARGIDALATYGFYAVIARHVPIADFGHFVLAVTLLNVGEVIATRGLDLALVALHPGGAGNRYAIRAAAMNGFVLAALIIAGAWILRSTVPLYWIAFAIALPFAAVSLTIFGALRAEQQLTAAAIAEGVVQPVASLIFAVIVAMTAPSIGRFALALLASWVLPLVFAARLQWRGAPLASTREINSTGASMLGVNLLTQASTSSDILLLGLIASAVEVAHYAVAQKIAVALQLLHTAIAAAAMPFIRGIAGDTNLLARYHQMITRWIVSASLPLIVLIAGAPSLILRFMGGDYAQASVLPVIILTIAATIFLACGPSAPMLLCTGHAQLLVRITAAYALITFLAVAALAHYGAAGAATGVLIGVTLGRALTVWMLRRFVHITPWSWPLALLLAGGALGVGVTRFTAPAIGEVAAVASGCVVAIAVAVVVELRSADRRSRSGMVIS